MISASPAPPHHAGITTTTVGSTVGLTDATVDGDWISSDNNIATVDENGMVNAIATGSVDITHTVVNSDGDEATTVTTVLVTSAPMEANILPNPNNGTFTVKGTLGATKDASVTYEVTDMLGQIVYSRKAVANGGAINEQVLLTGTLEKGVYMLNVASGNENKTFRFSVEK